MKRTVIGGLLMVSGLLTTLTIILAGSIYAAQITAWSGKSKLWYAIFGERQYGDEVIDSLFLGFPFVVGVIITVFGLIILLIEFFKTFNKQG
ncbi:hypothetical protein LCL89_05270 [Halobacillus yeomjeoni]|uniref:hypothetical protein n=1 Tax=Halobacillus yeomjeoni TaxID=311194 RepID=UPI001CD3DFEC|nr:hypothetical protein [Halobacillus yeomjeoni]MCA0983462.1 hypothetical protein [Halobacillus yeomjeoni]